MSTMDYDNYKKTTASVPSVLQSDEMFSSRILARQSTIGSQSSRIYYRASEGVPFQWETQPGKPIKPPSNDVMPPLSPPPAVLAMGLPKPCINIDDEEADKPKRWSKAWLVKMLIKKKLEVHKALGGSKKICNAPGQGNLGSSQRYYSESARFSSSSYASTSTSSSSNYLFHDNKPPSKDNVSRQLSRNTSDVKSFTCGPRGFSNVVVYFVKRS